MATSWPVLVRAMQAQLAEDSQHSPSPALSAVDACRSAVRRVRSRVHTASDPDESVLAELYLDLVADELTRSLGADRPAPTAIAWRSESGAAVADDVVALLTAAHQALQRHLDEQTADLDAALALVRAILHLDAAAGCLPLRCGGRPADSI
jgi:hypothetical protein